ncbi:hypothetical protein [Klebsiella grimontii]
MSGGTEGYNPTPYFVSVVSITQDMEGKVSVPDGGMIVPGGKSLFRT